MQGFYKYIILSIIIVGLAVILFIPLFPVVVVPEWEILFVNKNGSPASSISINQTWKDYSLEIGSSWEHIEKNLQGDSDGYIKLPARQIRVSVFQIIGSRIRDSAVNINPHSSSGSHSYIICQETISCSAAYDAKNEKPQRVVILR